MESPKETPTNESSPEVKKTWVQLTEEEEKEINSLREGKSSSRRSDEIQLRRSTEMAIGLTDQELLAQSETLRSLATMTLDKETLTPDRNYEIILKKAL